MSRIVLIKLIIDLVMTILMFVEMAYYITGNRVHENVGVTLFGLFIAHII
ncbi:hypothetical protein SAMN04487895_1375, partial [Paenibacillus sophorae]